MSFKIDMDKATAASLAGLTKATLIEQLCGLWDLYQMMVEHNRTQATRIREMKDLLLERETDLAGARNVEEFALDVVERIIEEVRHGK